MVRLPECQTCLGELDPYHAPLALKVEDVQGKSPRIWRWANHKNLRVRFMDGTQQLHDLVQTHVKEWSACTSITFTFVKPIEAAEVHVSFYTKEESIAHNAKPGHWSYVGADCEGIDADKATMNLNIKQHYTQSDWAEIKAVTLHEFGHTLGFIHEHLRKDQGWDEETIRRNVLNPLPVDPKLASEFDTKSIMMYSFTVKDDGAPFDVPENVELSVLDKKWAGIIYPK